MRGSSRLPCAFGALLASALLGCQAPQPATPSPVTNVDSIRILGSSRILEPEEAKALRDKNRIDPTVVEEKDDIVLIQQFWNPTPWLVDASGNPVGFRVPTYFVSGETEKGAFVPGTILAWIYEVSRDPLTGRTVRSDQPLHIWELDRQQALGLRVTRKAVLGYPYLLVMRWPGEIDVSGRTIEIELGYERLDKRVVLGTPQRFKVPLMGDAPHRPLAPAGDATTTAARRSRAAPPGPARTFELSPSRPKLPAPASRPAPVE